MKFKHLSIIAIMFAMISCSGSNKSTDSNQTDSVANSVSIEDGQSENMIEEVGEVKGKLTPYLTEIEYAEDLMELDNGDVEIRKVGEGENSYYVISPKIHIKKASDMEVTAAILVLYDAAGGVVHYAREMGGFTIDQSMFPSLDSRKFTKALNEGKDITFSFTISPKEIADFDPMMIEGAKQYDLKVVVE